MNIDNKNAVLISFLDKSGVPDHSFVNGVIASRMPNELGFTSIIFTSKSAKCCDKLGSYRRALLRPVLSRRRGLGRFINYFTVRLILRGVINNKLLADRGIVVFVRNCPILLKAANDAVNKYRKKNIRLIFQSSFPHEISRGFSLKSKLAIAVYNRCAAVDAVTAVSERGLTRVQAYFPNVTTHTVIPLLSDFKNATNAMPVHTPIKCVYIGTVNRSRQLDLIIEVAHRLVRFRDQIEFHFYGFSESDYMREYPDSEIQSLVLKGILKIHGSVERTKIPEILRAYDVGISLIPPTEMYLESSPTKLVEYLSQGLSVIANFEISRQKYLLEESGAGYSVRFDLHDIEIAFKKIIQNKEHVSEKKKAAIHYSKSNLNYGAKKNQFAPLLSQ